MKTLFESVDTAQRDLSDSIVKYDIDGPLCGMSLVQRVSRAIKGIVGIDQGNQGRFEMRLENAVSGLFIQPR